MISVIQKLWQRWCRVWNPAYEPPLPSDMNIRDEHGWRPATEAERAELLARLTEDLTD